MKRSVFAEQQEWNRRPDPGGAGHSSMRILTSHPRKLVALEAYGLKIVAQVPFEPVKASR
jgi:hypothetical protein